MKIAILNNRYGPHALGGAEKIAMLQAEELRRRGHDVLVLSLQPYGSEEPSSDKERYLASSFEWLARIPKPLRIFWHAYDIVDPIIYARLKNELESFEPDLVITHNLCGLGRLIIPYLSRYKHIHILHDISLLHPSGLMYYGQETLIDSAASRLYQRVNASFLSGKTIYISPSQWLLDLHHKHGLIPQGAKASVLRNPVPAQAQPAPRQAILVRRFLFVGHISRHKGLDILIAAWRKLADVIPEASLDIAGPATEQDLQALLPGLKNVRYHGQLDQSAIAQLMSSSDCLLVPSICYENSPTVIYEAITNGLLFAASSIGGTKELIEDFGGIAFVPEADELARLIASLYDGQAAFGVPTKKAPLRALGSAGQYVDDLLAISGI